MSPLRWSGILLGAAAGAKCVDRLNNKVYLCPRRIITPPVLFATFNRLSAKQHKFGVVGLRLLFPEIASQSLLPFRFDGCEYDFAILECRAGVYKVTESKQGLEKAVCTSVSKIPLFTASFFPQLTAHADGCTTHIMNATIPTTSEPKNSWLTRDVLFICLSACFADLGYQAVLAIFPLFLVMNLHAAVWVFALATAISYGPGAIFGLMGGRLGDRYGHKKIAITGNLFIPLLSLAGLAATPVAAVALFAGGWWARNFRSPPRRTLMTQMVLRANRRKAFGLLHALDIGGGFLAATGAMILIWGGTPLKIIFLITIIPLLCSSAVLALVRNRKVEEPDVAGAGAKGSTGTGNAADAAADTGRRTLYRRLLWATGLYGFSSFSFGFPILTVDQATGSRALAVLAYVVFFGVSALTGLVVGKFNKFNVKALALAGYLSGGVGAAGMAVVSALHGSAFLFYPVVALMGLALGVIETLEPTIISLIIPPKKTGSGMGALTATRSLGLFFANILMGLLYNIHASWVWAYGYAAILGVIAAGILLSAPRVEFES